MSKWTDALARANYEPNDIDKNSTPIPGAWERALVMSGYEDNTKKLREDERRMQEEKKRKRREEESNRQSENASSKNKDTGQAESIVKEFLATGTQGIASMGAAVESFGKAKQIKKSGFNQGLARKIYGDDKVEDQNVKVGSWLERAGKKVKEIYTESSRDMREEVINKEDQNILSKGGHIIAGGIASMTSAIGAGAIGGAVAGPAGAVAGSMGIMGLQEKGSAVEEFTALLAKEKGVDTKDLEDDDVINVEIGSNIYGVVAGILESITPGKFIGKLLGKAGKKAIVKTIAKNMLSTGATEGATEFAQKTSQNIIAKVRDIAPDIKLTEGALEEGIAGAITGMFTFGLGGGIAESMNATTDDNVRDALANKDLKTAKKLSKGQSLEELRELKQDMDNIQDAKSSEFVMEILNKRAKEVDTNTKKVLKEGKWSVLSEIDPQIKEDVVQNIKEIAPTNEEAQALLPKLEKKTAKVEKFSKERNELTALAEKKGINKKVLEKKAKSLDTAINKTKSFQSLEVADILNSGNIELIQELPKATQRNFKNELNKLIKEKGNSSKDAAIILDKIQSMEKIPFDSDMFSGKDKFQTKGVKETAKQRQARETYKVLQKQYDDTKNKTRRKSISKDMAKLQKTIATGKYQTKGIAAEAKKYKTADEFIEGQTMVYHGSRTPLKKFNNQGAFFTDDMNIADGYAGGENIYEGFLNLKKPLVIDAKGRHHSDLKTKWGSDTQEIVNKVDKTKYDGVIFKNINDSVIDDVEAVGTDTIMYPFNANKAFKNESQLKEIWNKSNNKYQDKNLDENQITEKEVKQQIAQNPILQGLTIKKVKALFTPEGEEAWGKYKEEIITYAENPDKTTLSHEAFHAFLDLLVSSKKTKAAFNLVRKRKGDHKFSEKNIVPYKEMSDLQAEEVIAQEFAEFFVSKKRPTNKLEQYFAYLIQRFKDLITGADVIDRLFTEAMNPANTAKIKKQIRLQNQLKGYSPLNPELWQSLEKDGSGVTLKTLKRISQDIKKPFVNKQALLAYANRQDIKQAERDLIKDTLDTMPDGKVSIKEFNDKVKAQLLPLATRGTTPGPGHIPNKPMFRDKYESISLPAEVRGDVADYKVNIYESPIKTSAGEVHFREDNTQNYFAHSRLEDMADNKTRRVIEVQSDLFQKGNLKDEVGYKFLNAAGEGPGAEMVSNGLSKKEAFANREKELLPLQPYRNTYQERIIKEELKQASLDGKTKLQFPTGETAMKIEGLGESEHWRIKRDGLEPALTVEELKIGQEVIDGSFDNWIITEVLQDGKFKAAPKDKYDNLQKQDTSDKFTKEIVDREMQTISETFDISGKVDTKNPIYRFYEKDIQKYLKKIHPEMQRITDKQGVEWFEINSTKEEGDMAVEAFKTKDSIDTEAFKNWFGDSKVVGEGGKPLVVYHGSPAMFNTFDLSKAGDGHDVQGAGFYFTNSKQEAGMYIDGDKRQTSKVKEKGRIISAYIKIENPISTTQKTTSLEVVEKLALEALGFKTKDEMFEYYENNEDAYWETPMANFGESVYAGFSEMTNNVFEYAETDHDVFQSVWYDIFEADNKKYADAMVKNGIDGVIIPSEQAHGGNTDHYIVFTPNQIKSIDNTGTFSTENDDIRYQQKNNTEESIFQSKEVTKRGNKVAELTQELQVLNEAKRTIRKDFINSADGQELIMKHDAMQEGVVRDIDINVMQGIQNHPSYRKEGEVTDDMADGYLMEKNNRYIISGRKGLSKYEDLGYTRITEIDSIATENGFDTSLDFLYQQAEFINQPTLLQAINEALLDVSEKTAIATPSEKKEDTVKNYDYKTLLQKTQDIKEDRRKLYEDQESFEIGQQAMKNLREEVIKGIRKTEADKRKKLEDEFKQKLESLSSRRKRIKMIQKHFNLTDTQMKRAKIYEDKETGKTKTINLMPNIQAMEDQEFEEYLDELYIKAQMEEELFDKREEVKAITWDRNLSRVDSLRESMGFKTLEEMSLTEMDDLIKVMLDAKQDDIFLTTAELKAMKNTKFPNAKTVREIRDEYKLDNGTLDFTKLKMSMFKGDTVLARQNPMFKLWVEMYNEAKMESDAIFLKTEKDIVELMKKARKSRKRNWKDFLAPKDNLISEYLEAESKNEVLKKMTKEEIAAARYIETRYRKWRTYLEKRDYLKDGGLNNYMAHINKGFLEKWRDAGFKEAVKELWQQNDESQATFQIITDTGQVLALNKFASQLLHRGEHSMDYTENVLQSFLEYERIFTKKKALDSVLPILDALVLIASPTKVTEKGLVMDRSLKTLYNQWINNKKGRKINLPGIEQGGRIDRFLQFAITYTAFKYLAGSYATQIAAFGGEQSMTYVGLGGKKYMKGSARLLTKQGQKIAYNYKNFVGKSVLDEFKNEETLLGKVDTILFAGFSASSMLANQQFLLGSLTDAEFQSGEVSNKRLAELKVEMGRWRVTEGSKSIIGSTTVASSMLQFKSWAVPVVNTIGSDLAGFVKVEVKDGKKSYSLQMASKQQRHELARVLITISVAALFASTLDDDDSAIKKKASRELFTALGAFDPKMWLSASTPPFANDLLKVYLAFAKLATWEKYDKTKRGEYKRGDLKGLKTLEKVLEPTLTKQLH